MLIKIKKEIILQDFESFTRTFQKIEKGRPEPPTSIEAAGMTPFEVEASAARDVAAVEDVAAGVDVAGVEDVAVGVVVAVGALGDRRPEEFGEYSVSEKELRSN